MPPMVYPRGSGSRGRTESNQLPSSSDRSQITGSKSNRPRNDNFNYVMDFISWSSTLLKLNGYEEPPNQQLLQQQAQLLSSCWPWISEQSSATRPVPLILDLSVLEAATVNHFWHPTSTSSLAVANFMSSTIMDKNGILNKQHQLSFGIDRILGDQVGVNRTNVFSQVPIHVWSRDNERQRLSVGQRQEVTVEKQVRENRQEQQAAIEQQQTSGNNSRRKRSWSRAVFSNLQRKGLEKRFQLQKYITKPDRRQLAAALQLTDAQVKVWFQNRRMKWRHNKEPHNINEMPCSSPVEQYSVDVVENLNCADESSIASTHVLLPKAISHPVRLSTFKKA